MGPFRFRLATVERLRESVRDDRRGSLAEALRALDLVADRLSELDGELAELQRRAGDAARPGPIDVDRLADALRYELLLKADRLATDQQRQTVVAEVERRREALVAADREVRVLEKLRETQQARHNADQARREQRLLDETAARGFQVREAN